MTGFRFDWRWAALILFVALLANGRSLPWPIIALALGAGGGYLLYMAWQGWGGRPRLGGPRVTYWRGQRVELHSAPRRARMPTWRELAPSLAYALIGMAMLLAALAIVLLRAGI